jgi:hypothetical protein
VSFVAAAWPVGAQTFEAVGVRALGMAGAFVAVADDASATYWNPAGLATGPLFSVLLDRGQMENVPDPPVPGAFDAVSRLFAMSAPPVGLSYYRLRLSEIQPLAATEAGETTDREGTAVGVGTNVVTQNFGLTVGQTIDEGLTVASTVRYVRARAARAPIALADARGALGEVTEIVGEADNTFDLDLGVMVNLGSARLGLVARNVREPEIEVAGAEPLKVERQVRAGLAIVPTDRFTAAFDIDLTRRMTPLGERRQIALGAEQWLGQQRRLGFRGGLRASTVDPARPAYSAGISVAARANTWIEAHVTRGRTEADRGWGLGLRTGF